MADYEFLTTEEVPGYIAAHPALAARVDTDRIASVEEIGDGNLNLVFIAKDADGRGLVVKQALPYVRMSGGSWEMTPERERHEVESLVAHHALVPDLVVEVLHHDEKRHIFAMEDLSDHSVWRPALNVGKIHNGVAERVGTYIGAVAFGTSLPELAVNARAVWVGSQSLALGNAVGSNIANIGLTLGAAALAAPLVLRSRAVGPLLVWLLAMTAVVVGFGLDGVLSRNEGLLLLAGFAVMLAFLVLRGRREPAELQADIAGFAETRPGLGLNLARVAIALVAMYFGAKWLVQSAPIVGIGLGMGPLVAGLLPVAIGTALPEVAAAIVAARRGQGDMVAGHVLGSSLFNLLVVLGGMAAFRPVPLPASFVRFELPAAFALALVLLPMVRSELRVSRHEGAVLLLAFAAWLGWELLRLSA